MLPITMYATLIFAASGVPIVLLLAMLAASARRAKRERRLLNHGDALSLIAVSMLSEGPGRFDDLLLDRMAQRFSTVAPHYATRENAAIILAVLEVGAALKIEDGVVALTHRGLQMRLRLANGEPTLGLAAAFQKARRNFFLTETA